MGYCKMNLVLCVYYFVSAMAITILNLLGCVSIIYTVIAVVVKL